jgi:alanyl aminopeptidase
MSLRLALVVVIASAGCAAEKVVSRPEDPKPDLTPPALRLPDVARPLRNRVELSIEPGREDFTGTIIIDLEVTHATRVLWLNASEIAIASAVLTRGAEAQTAQVVTVPESFVGLAFPRALAPGQATLTIHYAGKIHPNDGDGIYSAKEANDTYVFTQFESTDARQAFPCFDEPSYKVPWQLTLHTPKALAVFSNTPVSSETDEPNGMKAVHFAETPPLPAYLVAFAIGPFDRIDAGKTRNGTPIGIVVPRGRTGDVSYAATVSAPILALLEDYFGMPYPFAKLDLVAVPVFNAGAMENPGLITFRQEMVVVPAAKRTLQRDQTYASVAAHEMAHMWFGDYVTLAWWDDTWLNESFASWMQNRIVAKWQPSWDLDVQAIEGNDFTMQRDSLDSARAIHQPIVSTHDIANAFDGITYNKGRAVLGMIEHALGEDVFQRGVRAYLAKHARGNASYAEFVSAMSEATGRDLHPLFDGFVLQSGVPVVSFAVGCDGSAPRVRLEQRRYKPLGSKIDPNRKWTVPVCMKWGAGSATGTDCVSFGEVSATVPLSAKACPDWVVPNADGVGYYRSVLKGDQHALVTKARPGVSTGDRIGMVGDLRAAIESGAVELGASLQLAEPLAAESERHLFGESLRIVGSIADLVPDALRPSYARLIRRLFARRARELGWQAKPHEAPEVEEVRSSVMALVGLHGDDPQIITQARALTEAWLAGHPGDPAMLWVAVSIAARHGDQPLFDRLYAYARSTRDIQERERTIDHLGGFLDPAIAKQALALTLSPTLEARDTRDILLRILIEPRLMPIALEFLSAHFDEIAARLPARLRGRLASLFGAVCDDEKKQAIETTYRARIAKLEGGPRSFDQALERLSLCSVARKAQTPAVRAFLMRP